MSGSFVELGCDPSRVAEVAPRIEGAPDALWGGFATLAACPPGALYFRDATLGGWPGARARCAKKTPPAAMSALRHGGLLLRRPLAEDWLAEVPAADVTLRAVTVRDDRGDVSDAYVFIDVHAVYPLDRDGAGFEPFDPARPHGSAIAALGAPTWCDARRPPARIFRLLERPASIFADAALAAQLDRATRGAVAALAGRRRDGPGLDPPPWARSTLAPWEPDPAAGARAAEAFWALARGERSTDLRATALANPLYALAVALAVDRGPADDTRAAAARSPICAVPYAALVDRGAHPVTEASALRDGIAAAGYASRVTARIDDVVAAAMIASGGHDEASVARARAGLAAVREWLDASRR